ncbi:MAG: 4-phosphoerythronate dehydrogenase [Mariprofundus sp.]
MTTPLNIVADANIWGVEAAFSRLPGFDVHLNVLDNRAITHTALADTDILLTRSFTRVNQALLAGTPVRFSATATIGDDHYDKPWLEANNIGWANAAGSSTGSVVEYILTLLLELHNRGLITLPGITLGIIGVGRIGSRLAQICQQLGITVLLNDPPRARTEGPDGFTSLDDLLAQADLITLHTPLLREGEDCTYHLISAEQLTAFRGRGIINAARGVCLNNNDLLHWLDSSPHHYAALDCWENEPQPPAALFNHARMAIATPHIAGHSLDGKAANTLFAYRALCHYLAIPPQWDIHDHLPPAPLPVTITASDAPWQNLNRAVSKLYPLADDDQTMKSWCNLTGDAMAQAFTSYRRNYPVRRAWQQVPIHFTNANKETRRLADAIGLKQV